MGESADITARDAHKAAELQPDVTAERIGEVYAGALLGAARQSGQTAATLAELDGLGDEVFSQFPKLESVLGSPLVSHEDRLGLLDRVFGGRVSPLVLNFLKVVSRHGRLDCLRAIHRQAHRLDDAMRGLTPVQISTAVALGEAQLAELAASLRTTLGGELILTETVEPELIGGAVLRIGDTVYDGSVANQLQSLREQMIDRSVHEIQSRRDRFRNSTGS